MITNRPITTVCTVFITLLFPLIIWFAHGRIEPRWLASLLLLVAATRLFAFKKSQLARCSVVGLVLLAGITIQWNILLPLKLYPVLVSLGLLIAFATTLIVPPSMVEIFARMKEPNLPPVAIAYTRRVTQIWCGFFIVNGAIALATAIWASEAIWSLYTGVISYLLMGILFGSEFLYRQRFKRRITSDDYV
jgi:uncharacterized membrane protein